MKIVESITPVHSLWLVRPQRSCGVRSSRCPPKLPEHSRKQSLDTDGKRFRSCSVKVSGRSTMPWTVRRYASGSTTATPPW